MVDARELESIAREVAREAGELAHRLRSAGVAIAATKSALADIVTEADREVEALIRERLVAARPGDGFLGEEFGAEPGDTGVTWVIDPIDGTVNYAYGIPAYAVSIAAVTGDPDPGRWEVVAAVVRNPAAGEEFHASRGEGAWLGDVRLAVNDPVGPAGALLATGFGYDPATHQGDLSRVMRVMPLARDIRRIGSAALDLSFVAAGRFDGYFERGINAWDHAAGELLVREAGGVFRRSLEPGETRALVVAAGPSLVDELFATALAD